jgi:large subunit ribosomal protein L9e
MRHISQSRDIVIPEGVTVSVKARQVTVKGPRGTLHKNVGHVMLEMTRPTQNKINVKVLKINSGVAWC